MKIIHIITGLNDGGAEAVLYRLCISDLTYQHVVISLMGEGKYGPLLRKAGIEVHCLGMQRGRICLTGLIRLWRLLYQENATLVQTWMYHADLLGGITARFAGVRRVFWGIRHTTLEPSASRRTTMLVARLNAGLSRWVPVGIVCCAERAREIHRKLGYTEKKMVVIPNGYDLSLFSPTPESRQRLRTEWKIDNTMLLFGMVGRFDPQKDHKNLMAALSLLKKQHVAFRCLLVGTEMDTDNQQLATWLDQYALRDEVMLLGPHNDIPAVMNAIDIHVLSSSFGEAFPNVLAEAMACGTPCVSTDVGDAATIIGNTGWIVPPQSSELLAHSLKLALKEWQDQSAWLKRQQDARRRILDRFSIERMVSAYHMVWNRMGI